MTTPTVTPTAVPSTPTPGPVPPRRLLRSRNRVFAGVAAGIADYTGLPTMLVRLLFVASAFMGWGLLLYPALWLVIPES
jgi:phage shock protein PspC (stress-responsive transcriptional regulator)